MQFNDALALELGLEPATLKSATGLAWLSGVEMPAEAAPLAQAYAGHQFGQFSPHLGMAAPAARGTHRHGRTASGPGPQGVGPYAVFAPPWRWQGGTGPALREYLMGEAMHALGIPTTRALAVIRTGERVNREGSPPGDLGARGGQPLAGGHF